MKAEALPGWKWIGTKFVVNKQPLWKKAVQFATARFRKLLVATVVVMFPRLLTLWYARWFSPRLALARAAVLAGKALPSNKVVPERKREETVMKSYIDAKLSEPEQFGTSFLVVTGSQGIGKIHCDVTPPGWILGRCVVEEGQMGSANPGRIATR